MMFGISTIWRSSIISDGQQLLEALAPTGIGGLELEYRLTKAAFQQIRTQLKNGAWKVLSLHNYCPHPEILPIEKASGDAFSLSSTNAEQRRLAVKYSLRTIRQARELGARAVVFHLGSVAMNPEHDRWFRLYQQGQFQDQEGKNFVASKLGQRRAASPAQMSAALRSLEQLNRAAEKYGVQLGIENRYFYDEFPNFEEMVVILERFQGSHIGYWHDVGHGQTQETFGLCRHEELLKTFAPRLIGMHLHDCKEIGYRDHYAPGSGLVDFDMIKKYLTADAIRILEVQPQVSLAEVQQAIAFLKTKGIIS
ncbi:MAG: sugar phosphate isomerase/epimerase [candidate division KSB1 bacterium]|nr:sugar phosphate isomerase/epimerase [candidate division KSB1 bacterium]